MPLSHSIVAALPRHQPDGEGARLFLFAFRRMAAHGLSDAAAVHAIMRAFSTDFRRPLVLMRTLVVELSGTSHQPIQVAPACCPRMTACEASILDVVARVHGNPSVAALLLADLLGTRDSGVLAAAEAVASAFADGALPLA